MRRDLIIGILFSLFLHGGAAWVGEVVAHRPQVAKVKPKEPTIQLIEMPKIEPDEPEPTEETQQASAPADFAPRPGGCVWARARTRSLRATV